MEATRDGKLFCWTELLLPLKLSFHFSEAEYNW